MANDTTIMVRGRAGTTPRMMGERGDWTTFRLATSPRYRTREGEWRDGPTTWLSVHANGELATHVVQTVRKGVSLLVRGRMSTDRYVTQGGQEREQLRVVADSIGVDIHQTGRVFWHPPQRPTDVTDLEVLEDEEESSAGVEGARDDDADGTGALGRPARESGGGPEGGSPAHVNDPDDDLNNELDVDLDDTELDDGDLDDAGTDDAGELASPEILARAGIEPAF